MNNCFTDLTNRDKSYYDDWNTARTSNKLNVSVVSGTLNGTFGRFIGINIHYSCSSLTRNTWLRFIRTPSAAAWSSFCQAITSEAKKPKLRVLVNEEPWEVIDVSLSSCTWSFEDLPLKKVSKPRVKKIKEEVIPDVFDHLGEKINIGDFCSYILYHHRYMGAQIYYGTVTKITPKGDVYCTDVNVGDWPDGHNTPKEKKVLEPSMITILNESIMDRIILARLGA